MSYYITINFLRFLSPHKRLSKCKPLQKLGTKMRDLEQNFKKPCTKRFKYCTFNSIRLIQLRILKANLETIWETEGK